MYDAFMRKLICFVAVLILDRMLKVWITGHFSVGESVIFVPGVWHWTYVLNRGAAFGMLQGQRWIFILIAIGVLGALWFLRKSLVRESVWVQYGTLLFASGALGNLWDRFSQGAVIDFIDFRIWPVFNVADIAICIGAALMIGNVLWMDVQRKN